MPGFGLHPLLLSHLGNPLLQGTYDLTLIESRKKKGTGVESDSSEMELEEWEFLSNNNLCTSQTTEEKSFHRHGEDQPQVSAQIALLPTEDIKEILQGCDLPPQACLETTEIESTQKESVLREENTEIEITRNLEFAEGDDGASNQRSLKWRARGLIAALSSLGIAAAGFTMLALLGGSKENQSREIQIQIYAEDKGIEQVVQQSTKLNQMLSVLRGTPADVSFGGYYHGL